MNISEMRSPPGGFEDRLEAELVKVVIARAAVRPGLRQRAAAAMRRPALRAGVLAVGTVAAAAAGFAFSGPSLSHRPARLPQTALSTGPARFTSGRPRSPWIPTPTARST